jgi:hypothetical protein
MPKVGKKEFPYTAKGMAMAKVAAKKAPAKKIAAPKKSGNSGSANAAEKRVMDKKKQKTTRTDAAGRSGMGETVTSNVSQKRGLGLGNSPASLTAGAAGRKAVKEGKPAWPAYNKSKTNAQKAAGWVMDPNRPGIYVPKKKKK